MSARRLTLAMLLPLCGSIVGLLLCVAPALAARGHVFDSSFGREGSGNGEFSQPTNVAVNEATGDVYVLDRGNERVEYFSSSGAYLGQFNGSGLLLNEGKAAGSGGLPQEVPTGRFSEPEGLAVDNACYDHQPRLEGSACEAFDPSNGDVYVADTHGHAELKSESEVSQQVVDKFSATGEYVGQVTKNPSGDQYSALGFRELYGVAVDASGELWVEELNFGSAEQGAASYSNAELNEFIAFRSTFSSRFVRTGGFAVDSKDDLYVTAEGSAAGSFISEFDASGRLLTSAVVEEPSTGVATESSSDDVYVDNVGTVGRFGPEGSRSEGLPIERLEIPGMQGSGVGVNSATQMVYVADSAGEIHIFKLEEPSKPTVESESVSDISGNSATFDAAINSRGPSTEYRFEYGTSQAYGTSVPVPDASVGSGFEVHEVGLHLQDLQPGVHYHFRVLAHNEDGVTEGADETFTTQTASQLGLLDNRQWEMVSPPDKRGARIDELNIAGELVQASANGNAITYVAREPTEAEPLGYTGAAIQVFSTRDAGGWSSEDLGIPHPVATGVSVGEGLEHRFFSEDLSLSVVQPFGAFDPSLAPEASEPATLLATDYLNGDVEEPCRLASEHCYRPLVTGAAGYANVPPGTVFGIFKKGEKECEKGTLECGPSFVDATPDLSHVLLNSVASLAAGSEGGLYEWAAGELTPVPGVGRVAERHGLSDDGSRVILTSLTSLAMRDVAKGESIQLDAVQGGTGAGPVFPAFQDASSDASRVLFTDTQQLTAGSGASEGSPDLYECEMVEEAGKLACRLSDLTPPASGEPADVQGAVLGASEDGSYVYFVANGALAEGAVRGTCGRHGRETCNLYVHHAGVTKLIAVLSGKDEPDWSTELSRQTARVSPDGRWLTFMSQQNLTGYVTHDALSGQPDEEVYLYDASTGHLACASCNPTGARPSGVENGAEEGRLIDSSSWPSSAWLAANIPGWTPYDLSSSLYQSRFLSDSGRLFFNSSDALVPQDVNGVEDVYEYEPPGVGNCETSSTTYSERSGGCVDLISSGTSAEESAFLDASGSGGDVFFLTAAKLSPQDYDTALDVYDARECTDAASCYPAPTAVPPPCTTGDACKPSPTPQPAAYGAPASATFSGAGNVTPASGSSRAGSSVAPRGLTVGQKLARALKACHKKQRKARALCERRARKRYATKPSRKANATKKGRG